MLKSRFLTGVDSGYSDSRTSARWTVHQHTFGTN